MDVAFLREAATLLKRHDVIADPVVSYPSLSAVA